MTQSADCLRSSFTEHMQLLGVRGRSHSHLGNEGMWEWRHGKVGMELHLTMTLILWRSEEKVNIRS